MDKWQQWVYDKCVICTEGLEKEITLSSREAYVVMKALEDQQKYQKPKSADAKDAPVRTGVTIARHGQKSGTI